MKNKILCGKKIKPAKIKKTASVVELIDNHFQAYNSARLHEAGILLTQKMLNNNDTTICITLAGALTPAGMSGMFVSMMENGFVDLIISTGANLYHDMHFALNYPLRKGFFNADDKELWNNNIVRIYDIFMETDTLLNTDKYLREILLCSNAPKGEISSSEFHNYIGKKLLKDAKKPGISVLAQAARFNIPIYTSSPGDSTFGMDIARINIDDGDLKINPNIDVLETTSIVAYAKKNGAILLGGGSPKNFYLQTQPMLWECLGVKKGGHNYIIQITMDSPQWGGLSGATPSEAVSWGKVSPNEIKNTVVVYSDITLATPLLFSYAISKVKPRKHKKLYLKRKFLLEKLKKEYLKQGKNWMPDYQRL